MIEEVLDPENLNRAWKRVKANKGAPGIDGDDHRALPGVRREALAEDALCDSGKEPTARRQCAGCSSPSPTGRKRPLGMPTVLDRVIQQALAQVLSPLFESGFSDHSYGFREGRNAHQAVRRSGSRLEGRPPPCGGLRSEILLRHRQPRPAHGRSCGTRCGTARSSA